MRRNRKKGEEEVRDGKKCEEEEKLKETERNRKKLGNWEKLG